MCRAKINLGGREPAARRGRRDKADFSPTRTPTETLLQTSHIRLPSRQHVQLGLETPFGNGCQTFIISSGEAKTHLRCHPGSPVALPASSAGPGTAGSILATLMYPGQIPPVLEPARAAGMQHITKQGPAPSVVQNNTGKETSRGKRDAVVSILQRGCGLRPALCIPHPSRSCQEAGVAQRVLSGAGGDARHQLCNGHWQAQGRARHWLHGLQR